MKDQTNQYLLVPHDTIKVRENFNPRVKPFTEDIKPSIKVHGVRDALEVEDNGDGTYTLNAQGHRRLLAVTELFNEGIKKTDEGQPLLVPIKIVPKSDENKLLTEIITLNTGKPLELLEEAEVYGKKASLIEGDKIREKAKVIADEVGKTINHVMNLLNLLNATPVTKQLIEKGKASASLAIELFLSGTAKGDWQKVEDELTKAVAEAAVKGKKKATKADTSKGEKGEGEEGDEEGDEDKEEKEAAKKALKARNSELQLVEKKAMKYSDFASTMPKEAPEGSASSVQVVHELVQSIAAYVYPPSLGDMKTIETVEFGDINSSYKRLVRTINADVKAGIDSAESAAKATLKSTVEEYKAKIAKLNEEHANEVKALKAKK